MAGMNMNLLAGLVDQMHRMSTLARISKILDKKAEARTDRDLQRLLEETETMGLLATRGPAVHKDMCYTIKLLRMKEDEMLSLSNTFPGKGEVYCMVMSGQVFVQTEDMEPFTGKHDETGSKKGGQQQVTDAEMEDLFNSIDADGSGAIDVEEFGYALEMMGMAMSPESVKELMDSVDDDGSGELEFPEFQLILKEKLGIGKETTTKWESKRKDGVTLHSKYFGELSVFGESSVTKTEEAAPMTGQIRCTEDALICYITKERYHHILEHGFGGDLKRKQDLLNSHAVVQQCITRSDLKRIAHACKLEELRVQERLFAQGEMPTELIFVCEGTCKMQERSKAPDRLPSISKEPMPKDPSGRDIIKQERMKNGIRPSKTFKMVDVAWIQAGDIVGTDVVFDSKLHSHTVLGKPRTTMLRLESKDLRSLLHPADLEALRETVEASNAHRNARGKASLEATQEQNKRMYSFQQVLSSVKKYSESKDPLDCEHTPRTMETLVTQIVNKGAAGTAPDLRNKKDAHTRVAENLFMTNRPMMRSEKHQLMPVKHRSSLPDLTTLEMSSVIGFQPRKSLPSLGDPSCRGAQGRMNDLLTKSMSSLDRLDHRKKNCQVLQFKSALALSPRVWGNSSSMH